MLQTCLQAEEGQQPRTWLLPLLKQHVTGAELACWGGQLLPLGRAAVEAAAGMAGDPSQRLVALQLRAIEAQIWNTLPSFCAWPVDLQQAFKCAPLPVQGPPMDFLFFSHAQMF